MVSLVPPGVRLRITHSSSCSALSLRLFGEDVTVAAREAGKKKLAASSATSAVTQPEQPEPGLHHDDEDGDGGEDRDEDDNDDMDAEERER